MGKHSKFLKSEKAKVKLKGNKLKAPQNVTKTDFKVRKIIIPEQLKNVQERIPGKFKVHNITEVLARLKNASSVEGLSNLKDVIMRQPDDYQKHLEAIVKVVGNLSLSIEKADRKECFKILDIIAAQTSENMLRPFFPILVTFLKCAMTHIKPTIQEDSLLMLDVLLKHSPQLVSEEKDSILPPYLDMVSKIKSENKPERTLSVQLGNKITSIRWRKSVLERLITFLKCISKYSKKIESSTVNVTENITEFIVNDSTYELMNPYAKSMDTFFYQQTSLSNIENQQRVSSSANSKDEKQKIRSYIEMIMPLMFETWMEIKPDVSKIIDGENTSFITNESSLLLKTIMDIISELFNMAGESNEQFIRSHNNKFEMYFLSQFPYCQDVSGLSGSKAALESGGDKCVYQNLTIANLYLAFVLKHKQRFWKHRSKIFAYIADCINNWKIKDTEFNGLIVHFIRTLFSVGYCKIFSTECRNVFNLLIRKCNLDQTTNDPKLSLVCEIIEKSDGDLKKDSTYTELLPQMVRVLSEREYIPIHIIKTITTMAKQGNSSVVNVLSENIVDILKNLQKSMKIAGNQTNKSIHWQKEIANLVYWINDKDILSKISSQNKDKSEICYYIQDIVEMKMQME